MEWAIPIVVAVIGGPLMILFARFDKRNTQQHGANMKVLDRIEIKVDKLDDRLDGHMDWHSQKKDENK